MRLDAPSRTTAEAPELRGDQLRAVWSLWRKTGREVRAALTGGSMEPAVKSGSEVLIHCGAAAAVGAVVAVLDEGRLLVHRVVAIDPDSRWLLTRGDACAVPDAPILDLTNVLGVVRSVSMPGAAAISQPVPGVGRRDLFQHLLFLCCVAAMRLSPTAGRAAVASFAGIRRTLVLWPRHLLGRLKLRLTG